MNFLKLFLFVHIAWIKDLSLCVFFAPLAYVIVCLPTAWFLPNYFIPLKFTFPSINFSLGKVFAEVGNFLHSLFFKLLKFVDLVDMLSNRLFRILFIQTLDFLTTWPLLVHDVACFLWLHYLINPNLWTPPYVYLFKNHE